MTRLLWISVAVFVVVVHGVAYMGSCLLSSPHQLGWDAKATAEALPLARWDAGWYRSIASDGYSWNQTTGVGNVAFFPLYPMLVRALAASGLPLFWAATVLSHLCFVAAVVLLQRLQARRSATPPDHSQLFALLTLPWAFFLLAPYSEALFLALALGAFLAAHDRRWGLVAFLGFLAGLTRLFGLALVPPLLLLAFRPESPSSGFRATPPLSRALAACAPGIGFAAFVTWLAFRFRDPLAFLHAQQRGWGRGSGWAGLQASIRAIADHIRERGWLHSGPAVDLLVLLMLIATVVYALRSRHLADAAYVASGVALIVASGSLLSIGRYALVLFPVFGFLAVLGRRPTLWVAYLTLSSALQLYLILRFANDLWVA
jgi:Gpi18-like mannosyltransferase